MKGQKRLLTNGVTQPKFIIARALVGVGGEGVVVVFKLNNL